MSNIMFSDFVNLCTKVANVKAYTAKTKILKKYFAKLTKPEILLICQLLLPSISKRVYNLKDKQLIKIFANLLDCDQSVMMEQLRKIGRVNVVIQTNFVKAMANNSNNYKPTTRRLTLSQVVDFLEKLELCTRENDQTTLFRDIINQCTGEELNLLVCLVKNDLRLNAGPKHVLNAIDPNAYKHYQITPDLNRIVERFTNNDNCVDDGDNANFEAATNIHKRSRNVSLEISLMTPVTPMLADVCKSMSTAMKKCPDGMLAEIKYDGERVQIHKKRERFQFYSRSLKSVSAHKIVGLDECLRHIIDPDIDVVLDAEIVLFDTIAQKPLPFGTLGVHKKKNFSQSHVCLYVFDCLYYDGECLLNQPLHYRRDILMKHIVSITPQSGAARIKISEAQFVNDSQKLTLLVEDALQRGLEGLVLKPINSVYAPGKRHWLKIKKDYLCDGAMADSVDLVVLGAWYGSGKKGGFLSTFLMGCLDTNRNVWTTVTKVHTGHTDDELKRCNALLLPLMIKIERDESPPAWLDCHRTMIPDMIATHPKLMPVWEVTGAEFTKTSNVHTANGISIRFPRITRIREDKTWQTATDLNALMHLYNQSKSNVNVCLVNK
ncbi:dna ligase [Sucra jujuba nucleopolyhedrovirus]|uniref:DNA ligase n=1 Tax=Sucra jujuba nucleopolyhedrovirus TaxID=1563660 RepID=A0A097P911_9ABAC|nr:dna ligase [Sucra jujuba nucleopolyhedrovirus]AIU41289.1 dna ligase [Sucra jujuba nucleopolyhedrovirus]